MSAGYRVAGIDVHKSMLAVLVTELEEQAELRFQRRKFGTVDSQLKMLSEWLREAGVQEVVMESTAQYWKPVWRRWEGQCQLYLAQAQSNRAPRGRKRDCEDAERLVRRHVAGELILSFVPHAEQRLWRTITRTKHQLTRDRVRLQNQLESFLQDARVKLGTCVSDLVGVSSQRMLRAMAAGQADPRQLATLADAHLRCHTRGISRRLASRRYPDTPASPHPQAVSGAIGTHRQPTADPAPADRPSSSPASASSDPFGRRARLGA